MICNGNAVPVPPGPEKKASSSPVGSGGTSTSDVQFTVAVPSRVTDTMVALSPPVAADPSAVVTVMPTNGATDAPPPAPVNTARPGSAAGPPSAHVLCSNDAGTT